MATTNSESNHSRTEARERYHRVLRLVDYQSSGPQPPLVSERVIVMLAARAGHDPDDIRSSLQAAVESDDSPLSLADVRTLHELAAGTDTEPTAGRSILSSLGLPMEDVAWGAEVYRNAVADDIGRTLSFRSEPHFAPPY